MEWRLPNKLEERTIKKFAFEPKICSDGKARWLCWLEHTQEYIYYNSDNNFDANHHGYWRTIKISAPKKDE